MEPDDVLFDRIHRYLGRQMTEAEQQAFEASLLTNDLLSQELALQRQIKAGFQVLGYRQTLDTIRAELSQAGLLWQPTSTQQPPQPVSESLVSGADVADRRIGWVPYTVAASVLLALGISWFLYTSDQGLPSIAQKPAPPINKPPAVNTSPPPVNPQPTESPPRPQSIPAPVPGAERVATSRYDKLVDRYFNPTIRLSSPPPIDDERLGTTRTDDAKALQLAHDTIAIRTGMQLLRKGNAQAAIAMLTPTTRVTLPDWQANARWFLALAYLRNHQPELAHRELQLLTGDKPNLYTSNARHLTKALALTH